jgi:hypothetical protein
MGSNSCRGYTLWEKFGYTPPPLGAPLRRADLDLTAPARPGKTHFECYGDLSPITPKRESEPVSPALHQLAKRDARTRFHPVSSCAVALLGRGTTLGI